MRENKKSLAAFGCFAAVYGWCLQNTRHHSHGAATGAGWEEISRGNAAGLVTTWEPAHNQPSPGKRSKEAEQGTPRAGVLGAADAPVPVTEERPPLSISL